MIVRHQAGRIVVIRKQQPHQQQKNVIIISSSSLVVVTCTFLLSLLLLSITIITNNNDQNIYNLGSLFLPSIVFVNSFTIVSTTTATGRISKDREQHQLSSPSFIISRSLLTTTKLYSSSTTTATPTTIENNEVTEDGSEYIIVNAINPEDVVSYEKYYSISSNTNGPNESAIHTLTFTSLPGQDDDDDDTPSLQFQTGRISRLAAGSIEARRGDTVLLATASRDYDPGSGGASSSTGYNDFVPLSVEHTERFSAAGLTSGAFHKRDGRPSEREILTCRLIDRPIRPLLPKGWKYETQLLSWVLSYDGIRSCDPIAITASATALLISDIPFTKAVAAVEVGMIEIQDDDEEQTDDNEEEVETEESTTTTTIVDGESEESTTTTPTIVDDTSVTNGTENSDIDIDITTVSELIDQVVDNNIPKPNRPKKYKFVINPTNEQSDVSPLHLTIAGTLDGILMIEGAADFLPEDIFIQAIQFGYRTVQTLCHGITAFQQTAAGKVKLPLPTTATATVNTEIQQLVNELYTTAVDEYYILNGSKQQKGAMMGNLYDTIASDNRIKEKYPDVSLIYLQYCLKDLLVRRMYYCVKQYGKRDDGRGIRDIRRIDIETSLLPKVHGSALFTRGETQTIATVTLGDSSMRQKIDTIDGFYEKKFYLQYTFPPSSVGETGRVGMPGRREIGHGNLAERALEPIVPSETTFPYTIRVESLITESHGSSSMASVCGGCLALMDAGVPIVSPVAGIAMGMLLDDTATIANDETAIVLSDITGTEDALGTMDFKVAGNRVGITTFQLDIKCEGLTIPTMINALEQARTGRIHILGEMERCLAQPRSALPSTVPKMTSFNIPVDNIGRVIGPGGKQIRAIIEDFQLVNMDVKEDGIIQITSFDETMLTKAEEFVKALIGSGGGGRGGSKGGPAPSADRPKYEGPEPVEGEIYTGKITGVHQFGVFVEIMPGSDDGTTPGLEGLVHVSELARDRVRNCEGFMKSLDVTELKVKYLGKDPKGKIRLSRKAVLLEQESGSGNSRGGPRNNNNNRSSSSPPPPAAVNVNGDSSAVAVDMSQEEFDIIAQAIDGL